MSYECASLTNSIKSTRKWGKILFLLIPIMIFDSMAVYQLSLQTHNPMSSAIYYNGNVINPHSTKECWSIIGNESMFGTGYGYRRDITITFNLSFSTPTPKVIEVWIDAEVDVLIDTWTCEASCVIEFDDVWKATTINQGYLIYITNNGDVASEIDLTSATGELDMPPLAYVIVIGLWLVTIAVIIGVAMPRIRFKQRCMTKI